MKCKNIYSFKSPLVLVIFHSAWIDFSVYSAHYLIASDWSDNQFP